MVAAAQLPTLSFTRTAVLRPKRHTGAHSDRAQWLLSRPLSRPYYCVKPCLAKSIRPSSTTPRGATTLRPVQST